MNLRSLLRSTLTVSVLALPLAALAAGHHSGIGWFGEHVLNAVIHAVIYGMVLKLFHSLGLVPSLILGAAILAGAHFWYRRRVAARA